LSSIGLPGGLVSICDGAFKGCSSLSGIEIPNSVISVGTEAFDGTGWLAGKPDGMVYAANVAYCYKGTVPSSITIENGTKGIASSAFKGKTALKTVNIPEGVQVIGESAFAGSGLTSATIPSTVHYINDSCFEDCSALETLTLKGDIEKFGIYALRKCFALKTMHVYGHIKEIKSSIDLYSKDEKEKDNLPNKHVTLWFYNIDAPQKVEKSWIKTGTIYLYTSSAVNSFRSAFASNPGISVSVHTNVLYKMDDGSVYTVQWYKKGDQVTYPAAPVKEGYTFTGWNPQLNIVEKDENILTATFTHN
jgi:hypothetical protein